MVSLKVLGVILATLFSLDHIDKTSAGWLRVRVIAWKRGQEIQCPEWYGVACESAKAEVGNGDNVDFSGTRCKISPETYCPSQKRELSPITHEGLYYVPLPPKFDSYDIDGDKKITFEEFSAPVFARYQLQDPKSLKKMFDAADVNGDGTLDPDEFSTAPFIQTSLGGKQEEE